MKRTIKYYKIIWLKHDLPAGLSIFLVALPLCLGIALASGAPLYSGLLSGIIGGLLVSLVSGSQLAVSGPAAGLTTLVAAAILSFNSFPLFLLSVMLAGLFQVLLGILKMGAIANYFPSSVIKGMLAAIGIILVSKQVPLAFGYDQPDFWTSGFLNLFSTHHLLTSFQNFNDHLSRGAIIIACLSLSILLLYKKLYRTKTPFIPATLMVVGVGILCNLLFIKFNSYFLLKPTQLVQIPENIFGQIQLPAFSQLFSSFEIWKYGIIIGILATLETLLSIEAVDKLDSRNRITPVNRELIAQGIGNMVCGLVGAIPLTAVVVRGSANIDAGGRTKLASFTHGLFLLLAVLLVPFVLNLIPYASLAAILMITGFNLCKPKLFVHMWRLGVKQFIPFLATILIILSTDLLIGVSIGLLISVYFIIQNNFQAEYKVSKTIHEGIETYLIKLNSNVTFLNKVKLRKSLDEIPEYSSLIIDGSECNFIEYDILETISQYHQKAHDRHIEIKLIHIEKVQLMVVH
ncbi:MAG: hypothetical protein CFE21_02780 [Bacteroidetes bacterium B1(2017)]|nr:MAG: hypothetical protein CFE21_02780 [Bacteroidetes bacterium B1(2017)]